MLLESTRLPLALLHAQIAVADSLRLLDQAPADHVWQVNILVQMAANSVPQESSAALTSPQAVLRALQVSHQQQAQLHALCVRQASTLLSTILPALGVLRVNTVPPLAWQAAATVVKACLLVQGPVHAPTVNLASMERLDNHPAIWEL